VTEKIGEEKIRLEVGRLGELMTEEKGKHGKALERIEGMENRLKDLGKKKREVKNIPE
jgi:hypothetical protein